MVFSGGKEIVFVLFNKERNFALNVKVEHLRQVFFVANVFVLFVPESIFHLQSLGSQPWCSTLPQPSWYMSLTIHEEQEPCQERSVEASTGSRVHGPSFQPCCSQWAMAAS
jgi:hypothetical protein